MTVYRRGKSKIYQMEFIVNGKRISKTTGTQTKREAKAVEHAERLKILKKTKRTPQEEGARTLLLTAIEQTYEQRWKHTKDSHRSYRRAVNLAAIIGNIQLSDITDTTILHLTKTLEVNGSKSSTINRYLTCLKTVLRNHKQPVDGIKLRKEGKGRIRVLTKEEEFKVVNLLRCEHNERRYYFADVADLVEVLAGTGCRLGEILVLKYEDVNFSSNLFTVWINKSSRPRSIPLSKRVRSILEARQVNNPVQPFSMKSYQVSTAWNWVRKAAGVNDAVPHSLRHTFASRLVSAGVDLYIVKELLGHSTIQMTERYAHLAPHKLASAISVLED